MLAARPFNKAFYFVIALAQLHSILTFGQTAFLNFDKPSQYTNNFNPWNDAGGANGGTYAFSENLAVGVGGSGGVSVLNNSDTTASYTAGSWNLASNGATIILSTLLFSDGLSSGDKVQFGI